MQKRDDGSATGSANPSTTARPSAARSSASLPSASSSRPSSSLAARDTLGAAARPGRVQGRSHFLGDETPLPQPAPVRDEVGPLVGRSFGGYEVVSYIGEGPSGAVYRGEDLLGNAMAVKVLHTGLANRDRTDQLRRELERLSALDHPQLQKIYDSGYGDEGQFFYVTEELVGCDLETGLEDSGGLAPRKSYEIIRAVCTALEAAHQAGVLHGGLRPRNVFLMPMDRGTAVKVLDFGAARLGGGSERGIVAGLPSYLAPEQMSGPITGTATPQSDLYSLGVLMHELFAGSLPGFRGGQASALAGRRGPVAPPPGVDGMLSGLIMALLDVNPIGRPASAAAVLLELDRWAKRAAALLDPNHPAIVRRRGPSAVSGSIGPDSTMRMSKFDAIALAQETIRPAAARPVAVRPLAARPSASLAPDAQLHNEQGDDASWDTQASLAHPGQTEMHVSESSILDEQDADERDAEEPTTLSVAPTAEAPFARAPRPIARRVSRPADDRTPDPRTAASTSRTSGSKHATEGRRTMTQNPTSNPPSPSTPGQKTAADTSSESVEASLEDFITQANAAFPTADGWDLHTGDVELIEDEAAGEPVPVSRSAAAAPRRTTERTEVVSQPLPAPAAPAPVATSSWATSPVVVAGLTVVAVVAGAFIAFSFMRTMTPPAPTQVIVTPAPAPAPVVAAPVVTPLPPAAGAPAVTVTPIAAAPAAAPTVAPAPTPAAAAAPVAVEPPEAALVHEGPKTTAPVVHKKAAAPKKAAVAAAPKKEPAPAKEAAAPKKEAPAKKESKKGGSDWVDPFAN